MSIRHTPEPGQDQLLTWDRQHYWHAFTQMAEYQPLLVDRAEGVWLFDQHGRRLLDGVSSMWCNVHGHRQPAIDQAIRQQLDKVAHVTSLGMSNTTTIRLAKMLVDNSPAGLESVFFSSDGACAIEVALKMAFQYWRQCPQPEPQRDLFLAVGNAYHGDTLGSVSVGGVERFHAMFDPLLFQVARGPCPDTYRLPEGCTAPEQATDWYLAEYARLFERWGERLAGVIVEPLMQCAAGMIRHPSGFLAGLKKLANEYGALFIADEIAVGMGRSGKLWACEWEDVRPDLMCIGKGLSGGMLPVAATLASRRVWSAFLGDYAESRSFFHGHTFGGNPLGCAAAIATLELMDQHDTLENVRKQSQVLWERLQPLQEHPHVGDLRCLGLMAGVELVADRPGRIGFEWAERRGHAVCEAALTKGVWLRPLGNVLVLMPPLCSQTEHVELLVEAVRWGIETTLR